MELTSNISGTWAMILLVLGFGFIIFVHELGHFLVAKWVGIKVSQFAIGFGHALLCWRKGIGFRVGTTEPDYNRRIAQHLGAELDPHSGVPTRNGRLLTASEIESANRELGLGETEYRLNWMPLGGYVKMLGQDDMDPTALSDDPRAFNNKPVWARVCVVSAGVIMNAIFAVIFFQIAFLHGVEFPPAIVGSVEPDSPAAMTAAREHPELVGLQSGDRIVLVDGSEPSDFTSVRIASALAARGKPVELVVERPSLDGSSQRLTFNMTPEASKDMEGLQHVGIQPPDNLQVVSKVKPDSDLATSLAKMGIRPGMTLTQVDGRPVSEQWQVDRLIQQSGGKEMSFLFHDDQGDATYTARPTPFEYKSIPAPEDSQQAVRHVLGLVPPVKIAELTDDSAVKGVLQAGDIVASLADTPWPTLPMVMYLITTSEAPTLPITVIRDGKRMDLTVTPAHKVMSKPKLGVALEWAIDAPIVASVLEDSPFASLNLKPGTVLDRIGDHPIAGYADICLAVQSAKPGAVDVTCKLPVEGVAPQTQPFDLTQATIDHARAIQWDAKLPLFVPQRVMQRADNAWDAIGIGLDKTHLFMMQTYVTLQRLIFDHTVQIKNLRGPVGIAVEGTKIAEQGYAYLFFFMGLISINLAVINFLPLPIVDGGLFVLLMIEKARGRPVSPQIQSAITVAGLILLGTIFLVVTFHDIGRIFG